MFCKGGLQEVPASAVNSEDIARCPECNRRLRTRIRQYRYFMPPHKERQFQTKIKNQRVGGRNNARRQGQKRTALV